MDAQQVSSSSKFKFVPAAVGYVAGDDRVYDVEYRGHRVGMVERGWLVAAHEGAEPVRGWNYRSNDGSRFGEGRTRKAAVLAAYGVDAEYRRPGATQAMRRLAQRTANAKAQPKLTDTEVYNLVVLRKAAGMSQGKALAATRASGASVSQQRWAAAWKAEEATQR